MNFYTSKQPEDHVGSPMLKPADTNGQYDHALPIAALTELLEEQQTLPDILSAFLEWLTTLTPVELVAFWNPHRQLNHLVSNSEGDQRTAIVQAANGIIHGPLPRIRHWRHGHWLFHLWLGAPLDRWDRLLIVENGVGLPVEESNVLLRTAIETLQPNLTRAF